jgi:DNA repair protein RadC
MRDLTRETFVVIFLTCRCRVIREQTIFQGTLTEVDVKPREIIREALNLAAASLVFAHNHPSYDPTPSPDDRNITARLKRACDAVDIKVLDHIIIGGSKYFSFADEGLL